MAGLWPRFESNMAARAGGSPARPDHVQPTHTHGSQRQLSAEPASHRPRMGHWWRVRLRRNASRRLFSIRVLSGHAVQPCMSSERSKSSSCRSLASAPLRSGAAGMCANPRREGRHWHHDAVIGCLFDAGFAPLAAHAFAALGSDIYGFPLQDRTLDFGTRRRPPNAPKRSSCSSPPRSTRASPN